jgi:enediyne biosynthesis protein E4
MPVRKTQLVFASALLAIVSGRAFQPGRQVRYPARDAGVDSLASRAQAQKQAAGQIAVFHQFQFEDGLKESGITFVHRIVDDAGLLYKKVHYDHGSGIAVADVDGDGLPDIYFVNQAGPNQLWRNLGGSKFRDITATAGVSVAGRISVAASFGDIDNDGDADLFVTTVRGGNLLFENDGHGKFRDITKESGVGTVAHSSGSFFFDYNRDGLLDLLVCNVGRYTTDRKGTQGQYLGLPDAFSGHMYPERFERPILFRNQGHNVFRDVTAEVKLRPEGWCGDASFTDLNGDG